MLGIVHAHVAYCPICDHDFLCSCEMAQEHEREDPCQECQAEFTDSLDEED